MKRKNPVIMKHLSFLLLYFVSLLLFFFRWELFVGGYICCLCQYSWVVLTRWSLILSSLISDQKRYYLTITHRSGGEWWCLVYTKTVDSVEGALSLVISNYLLATSGGSAPEKVVTAADTCRINEFIFFVVYCLTVLVYSLATPCRCGGG